MKKNLHWMLSGKRWKCEVCGETVRSYKRRNLKPNERFVISHTDHRLGKLCSGSRRIIESTP